MAHLIVIHTIYMYNNPIYCIVRSFKLSTIGFESVRLYTPNNNLIYEFNFAEWLCCYILAVQGINYLDTIHNEEQ